MTSSTITIQYADINFNALDYCRHLLSQGYKPDTILEVYRGDVLALRCHVGKAAKLKVHDGQDGPRFVKYHDREPAAKAA